VTGSAWSQIGALDAEFAGAGARPLAMGGAFLALADDSTAAEFNPAGIRILRRPEIAWQVTRTYDSRDEFLPITSSYYNDGEAAHTRDHNIWNTPSFVSYVHPGQDYTWAISQLTTINFVQRYDDPSPVPKQGEDLFFTSRTEATNNCFGFTFAKDIQPRLHVGMTLRMNRFDFMNESLNRQELTDWSPNVNLGMLWRKDKDWSFGAVFKSSQKVEGSVLGMDVRTKIPETWGFGAAYHPNDKLRLLADIDYINWSEFDGNPQDDFIRNDVTRYHLGAEYLLKVTDEEAWFFRGGYMLEESNAFFYSSRDNPPLQDAFPEEDDKNHLTVGFGVARDRYQLDLAVDYVLDGATTLILAMIHYF
jgi:long-subunit fatty acid transport protein